MVIDLVKKQTCLQSAAAQAPELSPILALAHAHDTEKYSLCFLIRVIKERFFRLLIGVDKWLCSRVKFLGKMSADLTHN